MEPLVCGKNDETDELFFAAAFALALALAFDVGTGNGKPLLAGNKLSNSVGVIALANKSPPQSPRLVGSNLRQIQ